MILFRSLQPGKFHGDPIVIKPPAVNKDGMAEWRQPGTGFGYAVCGVDLNNDGWVEVLQNWFAVVSALCLFLLPHAAVD